jgi:N-carbamoylputrescine amidase
VLNTQVVVGPTGLVGVYAKTHAPRIERPAFDLGDDLLVFAHEKVTFGIQICYDIHFPALSSAMAGAGAELVLSPHASAGVEERADKVARLMRYLPARAYDNAMYVAVCNASGTSAEGEALPGICLLIDPHGRMAAISGSAAEEMLVVDCPARPLADARGDANGSFADDRRPDLYGRAAWRANEIP